MKHDDLTVIQGLLFGEEEWGMNWLESGENRLVNYTIVEIKVGQRIKNQLETKANIILREESFA